MKKNLLLIFMSIIIIVLLVVTIINNIEFKELKSQIRVQNNNNNTQEEKTTKKIMKNENIVFFGDSITQLYPLEDIYGKKQIVRSGVSGYKTTDLLEKMDTMLYQYNPTKVILLIGTNDIMRDVSEEKQEETVNNIKEICTKIKQNRPLAKIYVESLYPVNRNMKEEMVAERNNEVIQKINSNIEEYCKKEKITYINMYDELTDADGNFAEKYTYDGLHPSTLGFAKITKVLMPYIYE